VRAALRVLVTYRLCDIGLLVSAVALHRWLHSTAFADIFAHLPQATHGAMPMFIGLGLLVAAMGKSAQIPVGGWLPRAMEGPTASSAVFYGGLSVHMGVYLLLRSAPLLAHSPGARLCVLVIGAVTAVMAALSGQVSADAKSAVAYATISQVGLMFVEIGLGLPRLALLHLAAHSLLRYYQFLRTPSTLAGRAGSGVGRWQAAAIRFGRAVKAGTETSSFQRFLYRLAIERFAIEAVLDRWIARGRCWRWRGHWVDEKTRWSAWLIGSPAPVPRTRVAMQTDLWLMTLIWALPLGVSLAVHAGAMLDRACDRRRS
jgi:NADH-quinone oxidoreductase subunit L